MRNLAVSAAILLAAIIAPSATATAPSGGAVGVRVLLTNEVAAQNAGNMRAFYRMYDPVVRDGGCSFRIFARSWRSTATAAGLGRDGQWLRYSNIHIWTDDVTGDYAFATYDIHIGKFFVGHVGPGQDGFVRRDGRWFDKFDNSDYAADCFG
jgi:hypothetical protein